MPRIRLEPKTARARRRINDVRWAMLKTTGAWTNCWDILEERAAISADPRQGPFYLVAPQDAADAERDRLSRWIHATGDKNFRVAPITGKAG